MPDGSTRDTVPLAVRAERCRTGETTQATRLDPTLPRSVDSATYMSLKIGARR
jgi:hypothetical protein